MMGIRPEVTWITWLFTLGIPAIIFILAWLASGCPKNNSSPSCNDIPNDGADNISGNDIDEGFF